MNIERDSKSNWLVEGNSNVFEMSKMKSWSCIELSWLALRKFSKTFWF